MFNFINKDKLSKFPDFVTEAADKLCSMYERPEYESLVITDVFLSPEGGRTYDGTPGKASALILFSTIHHDVIFFGEPDVTDTPVRVYSFAYVTPDTFFVGAYKNGCNVFQQSHYVIRPDGAVLTAYDKEYGESYERGYQRGLAEGEAMERPVYVVEEPATTGGISEDDDDDGPAGVKGKLTSMKKVKEEEEYKPDDPDVFWDSPAPLYDVDENDPKYFDPEDFPEGNID